MNILDEQDKRQTAILPSGARRPGYFRIGFIILDIPPEDIVTTRVTNADEETPLRAKYPMFVKTGQSRWDVTIRWTALASASDEDQRDFAQWEDLRYIVAMFKAAPFIEVENAHLRQVFFAIDPSMEHQRLAFGLRQLRIETSPDMVNAVVCTLTMTYFNYFPYTTDFGYIGPKNDSVSAYQSPAFKEYLDTWIDANLTEPVPTDVDDFPVGDDWDNQTPGTLKFKWRVYMAIGIDQADPTTIPNLPKVPAPTVKRPPRVEIPPTHAGRGQNLPLSSRVSTAFADRVSVIGDGLNIDPGWLMSVMNFETGGTFSPSIANSAGSGAVGLIQFTRSTAHRLGTTTADLASMTAVDQLDYVNAYFQPYSGRMTNIGDVAMAVFAPVAIGKTDDFILYRSPSKAYFQNRGLDVDGKGFITRGDYINAARLHQQNNTQPARVVETAFNPAPTDPAPVNKAVSQQGLDKANADMAAQVSKLKNAMEARGWKLDYSTEKDTFFYQENDILLTDASHGDEPNELSLYPESMAVLFVNNLAQIPLSSYQYPTYQHIGPATTLVSVNMTSNGLYKEDVDIHDQEAVHPGIQAISAMAHTLEDQFQRMKSRWRSVVSIHRMQAVRVYNQFLNMVGVHSLLLKDVNTATIQESPNAVSVQVTGAHYENFFEEVGAYLVKGVTDAYKQPFIDYLKNDLDKGLNADGKKNIFQLIKFRDAMKNRDVDFVGKILYQGKVGVLSPQSVPFPLTSADNQALANIVNSNLPGTAFVDTNTGGFAAGEQGATIASQYPQLATNIQNGASFSDILLLNGIIQNTKSFTNIDNLSAAQIGAVNSILTRARATGEVFNQTMDSVYEDLLNRVMAKDEIFRQEVQLVVNDPKFRDKVKNVGHSGGTPSADNPGHGAYRDLGIRDGSIRGEDPNPGSYFIDHSKDQNSAIRDGIRQVGADTTQATAVLNKRSSNAASPSTSDTIDNEIFLKAVNPPEMRMAAAFPTYKLFLIEEDNGGKFYAFDDFYSYSSVTDIEIIKFRDRPHLAKITMTNLAKLLSHKLYDDTVMGKHEAEDLNTFGVKVPATDTKGRPITGPIAGAIEGAGERLDGTNYIKIPGRSLAEGFGNGFNEIPLAYFPLQPGTKIEVRMGFSNDPDQLTRVFSGVVAEIEGDEILTITAQGFQAELMELAGDKTGYDGWVTLNLGKGPRWGGGRIWGDAGDTGSIMKKLLQVSAAKHFGHWQLLRPENPLMRGWPWERTLGIALESLGSTTIGPLLQTSSDRTAQNILINHVINADGTINPDARGRRTFFSQTPWWAFSSWYSLDEDKDKERTIWDIIQDVSRRYPEFILSVKDYGFPFACNATLVFGHPRDFYYARPYNFDEARNERALDKNATDDFPTWWKARGRQLTITGLQTAQSVSPYLLRAIMATGIPDTVTPIDNVTGNPPDSGTVIDDIDQRGVVAFTDMFDRVAHSNSRQIGDFITSILPNFVVDQGKFDQSLRELLAIQRAWQIYRDSVKPNPNSQLLPIRKYHYVDFQSIVHNGLVLNEKIFNAIRIRKKTVRANANIPANYLRVLDVDDVVIEPESNVEDQGLTNAYAQSFLREEVGKMYRGDIILRGLPKIDPWDVLFIADPSTGMTGPVIVDKVIHSFSQDQGYISIVTPMAYVSINEAAGQDFARRLAIGLGNAYQLAGAAFHQFLQEDTSGQAAAFLLPAAATLTAAGTLSAASSTAAGLAAPVVTLLPAAAASPPGWLAAAVLGALAVGGAGYILARNEELNPILISPLMRFGKPWIGGLDGYEVGDFARLLHNEWRNFWIDEVEPTLLSYKIAKGYVENNVVP